MPSTLCTFASPNLGLRNECLWSTCAHKWLKYVYQSVHFKDLLLGILTQDYGILQKATENGTHQCESDFFCSYLTLNDKYFLNLFIG